VQNAQPYLFPSQQRTDERFLIEKPSPGLQAKLARPLPLGGHARATTDGEQASRAGHPAMGVVRPPPQGP